MYQAMFFSFVLASLSLPAFAFAQGSTNHGVMEGGLYEYFVPSGKTECGIVDISPTAFVAAVTPNYFAEHRDTICGQNITVYFNHSSIDVQVVDECVYSFCLGNDDDSSLSVTVAAGEALTYTESYGVGMNVTWKIDA